MVSTHSATDNEKVGGEEHLNVRVVALEAPRPCDPIQFLRGLLTCRSLSFGIVAVNLKVTKFRIWN